MPDPLSQDQWLQRVLGVSVSRPAPRKVEKRVRFAPVSEDLPRPPRNGAQIITRPRSGATIRPPPPPLKPRQFVGVDKTLSVARKPGGGVVYTAPPPPVKEITFSGGGAKGAALPGAIKALQDSGVLKDAKKIAGASVGSMTAALIAAGATADEFTEVANADATTDEITEGSGGTTLGLIGAAIKNKAKTKSGNPLTGQGLENVVARVVDQTLRKRIEEYRSQCEARQEKPDADVQAVAASLTRRKPTFMDLRKLSRAIPAVKEVVITGTYTTELDTIDAESKQDFRNRNDSGQLYVFDADSEPDMEIAVAVHASASFPAAFKPVDIRLASGLTVRFIDGGVMNNTPTSSSLANERKLDPVPDGRGMTFVFESSSGSSNDLLAGKVTPGQGKVARVVDWFVGSEHSGAEYAKNRDASDRPEEIVVIPLTIEPKKKKWYQRKDQDADMRGGTLNFNLPLEAKVKYQAKTEQATNEQIEREKGPKTREFASDSQMFVSIGLPELKTLADGDYAGAAEAIVFRERVAEMIAKLQDAVKAERAKDGSDIAGLLQDRNVSMALDEFDTLAGDNVDFQGYAARELAKRPELDSLLEAARKGGVSNKSLKAAYAVSDVLRVRTHSDNILKQLVYPKMKTEPVGGAGIETLLIVEGLLRAAVSVDDVNAALSIAVSHFLRKSDKAIPKRGHKAFAQQVERRVMR